MRERYYESPGGPSPISPEIKEILIELAKLIKKQKKEIKPKPKPIRL